MGAITEFGMGMGLAGAAGIRARYPLLILGLLARYADEALVRPTFNFMGSSLIVILIAFLIVLDFFAGQSKDETMGYAYFKLFVRASAGGIVFAVVFPGVPVIWGLVFGAAIAIVAHFVDQRVTSFLQTLDSSVNSRYFHEILAFLATVIILVLPVMGYVLWVFLIALVLRNKEWQAQENRSYRKLR